MSGTHPECPRCLANEPHACTPPFEGGSGAEMSACGNYRYALYRAIPGADPSRVLVMIGHNPSTADAVDNDPTIRRCISFARMYGYGMLVMVNLFAYRATRPEDVPDGSVAVGPDNYPTLCLWFSLATKVCCAWGAIDHRLKSSAVQLVQEIATKSNKHLWCLGTTKEGAPRHPLYLPGDSKFIPWRPHEAAPLREGWNITDRHGEPVWHYYNGRVWVIEYAGPRGVPYWLAYRATEPPARNAAFWSAMNVRIGEDVNDASARTGFPTLEAALIAAEKAINGS